MEVVTPPPAPQDVSIINSRLKSTAAKVKVLFIHFS
jgi:hypothetical protein